MKFKVADVRTVDFQSSSFDVVFTKDALFHNSEKKEILSKIMVSENYKKNKFEYK